LHHPDCCGQMTATTGQQTLLIFFCVPEFFLVVGLRSNAVAKLLANDIRIFRLHIAQIGLGLKHPDCCGQMTYVVGAYAVTDWCDGTPTPAPSTSLYNTIPSSMFTARIPYNCGTGCGKLLFTLLINNVLPLVLTFSGAQLSLRQ
jgi:hypothetical protein